MAKTSQFGGIIGEAYSIVSIEAIQSPKQISQIWDICYVVHIFSVESKEAHKLNRGPDICAWGH